MLCWFNTWKSTNYIKGIRDKKHMTWIDTEKSSDKIQHIFMTKIQLGIQNIFLSLINSIYKNLITNHHIMNTFSPWSKKGQRCLLLSLLFKIVVEVLVREIRPGGKNASRLEKRKKTLYLKIINLVYPKESSKKKLLRVINEFSKFTGYKNNKKSIVFLHHTNE